MFQQKQVWLVTDNNRQPIVLRIEVPKDCHDYFTCTMEVIGTESEIFGPIAGIDAIQARELVIRFVELLFKDRGRLETEDGIEILDLNAVFK